jgi:hypothetical protein
MSPESVLVLYFNLCAAALAGWRTTRRRGATSQGWRIFSLMSAATLTLLLITAVLLLLMALAWHGC